MSLFRKKESIEQIQKPSDKKEGFSLSAEQQQEINQRITEINQRIEEIKAIRTDEDKWNKLEDDQAQALFDEYTEIKKEQDKLQRKLEGKPENTVIVAETKEGKEIEFNLEQIKIYWIEFYEEHNLPEMAEILKNTEINLTDEQIEQIKQKAEQGFDRLILMPPIELQKQLLQRIKEETEKPLKGLKDKEQYADKGTYLWDSVKNNIDHIQTNNRSKDKPYLILIKDDPEPDKETLNKSPQQLREIFKQKQQTGLTLEEYLIFQRDYTQRHEKEDNPHPDTKKVTWLLDSELDKDSGGPGHVLDAGWLSGGRLVLVNSHPADGSNSDIGARSSAIFEI